MRAIYEPANGIEAYVIIGLLKQIGIEAHVAGEHLQGGAGQLPAFSLMRIMVEDRHAERARQFIEDWDNATTIPPEPE